MMNNRKKNSAMDSNDFKITPSTGDGKNTNPFSEDKKQKNIILDFKASHHTVDEMISERCNSEPIVPELVTPNEIRKPDAYNRFKDLEIKETFRKKLLYSLHQDFITKFGSEKASHLIAEFKSLAHSLDEQGAVIFGDMIQTDNFNQLIQNYSQKLASDGSNSWIHSYINLGNHPDFLNNAAFNGAFFHPLLIALIAYGAGGSIRLVDARGKDAEPLAVQAQDNMLHIDNTPFRKEYKVILTWERGKASGPKGQNFVFIPGTHKGVRNCKVSQSGEAWSTEDASIFITKKAVNSIFQMQKNVLGLTNPEVIEASHPDMPLTTLFEAGALVHHRYRTKEKNVPRSCVIVAFHRAQDNPGQFLSNAHLEKLDQHSLTQILMGKHDEHTDELFINAILANAHFIENKIQELSDESTHGTKIIPFNKRELKNTELEKWKATVTAAPTVETIKIKKDFFHLGDTLSHDLLCEMIKFDKHGPLDLILFGDGHEEIRKWARNQIREMPMLRLENRISTLLSWDLIKQISVDDLLSPTTLKDIAIRLVSMIDSLPNEMKNQAHLDEKEKISSENAYRSMRQFIDDLGEAIIRCTSRQAFLSTSLFLFWACDELSRLLVGPKEKPSKELMEMSRLLLTNYVSTYVLIEKQIQYECILENQEDKNQSRNMSLVLSNLSLFNKYLAFDLENNRHKNPNRQHEYDKRFGLIKSPTQKRC